MTCLLIVTLALAGSSAFGADVKPGVAVTVQENTPARVVLQYQLEDYTGATVIIDGQEYTLVTLGKEAPMLVQGAPDLPHVCRSIIIPDDAEMDVKVVASEYHDLEGVDVAPSKGSLPRTVNPEDVPYTFGSEYKVDAFYPGEVAALGEVYILRDQRGLVVDLMPFQYNPVTRTLRAYKSVTLEVANVGLSQVNVPDRSVRSSETSLAFHNIYQIHFLNYNPGPRYAPLDETGSMLIICYDAWLTNVAPLVTHKNSIGISTTAVGVSTIGTSSTQIKNYIQSQYGGGSLAFVLLVGDAAQVATPTAAGGSSDPTYSLLAGSDNYPDIMVGRFSAETPGQVDTQVQRTIEYELMPATLQTWFWKGLGIGSEQGTGDEGEMDYEHIANIRTVLLAHGYTLVDGLYGPSSPTAAQVSASLNGGRGIVNYCGHGSVTAWTTTGFSSTNVAALTNDNMLPFIFSVACVNGQFSGTTCFGEAWLRSTRSGEPIGAIGAYMSSINQDWDPPMQAQDEFNALYCDGTPAYNCYGTLCYAGSCSMMDAYGSTSGSSGANMFLTWHVFGDPSLRVIGEVETGGLAVTPADGLTSSGGVGGPFSPNSKVYTLQNQGTSSINYTVSKTAAWVTLSNTGGTLTAGGSTTVTVSINSSADSLGAGSYNDTVTFTNTTDHQGDTTRPVTLQVLPALAVTPADGLTSSGIVGGPFSPSSKAYTLQNQSGSSINYTVSKTADWVTLSSTGGTLTGGGSTTITVSINSGAGSLAVGSYNDTVSFINTTNHSGDTTRPVSLTVNPLSNDLCANAFVVCPGTYTGTTVGMAVEGSNNCDGSPAGPDVWFKYTPGSSGSATFSGCSSGTIWDSVLSVHSACVGTSSNQLACDDDGCPGSATHGTITMNVTGGTTYIIRYGGYDSTDTGPFTLTISGPACAYVDSTPPSPNPMTFAVAPAAASATSITMTASTATDPNSPPVSYYFHFVSGGSGGSDSAWQSSTTYTDTGLTANTSYTYQVKARDSASTPNETGYSGSFSATTFANVPTAPTLSGATQTTLNLDVNANGNPATTEFAVQCTGSNPADADWVGKYVSATGTASAAAVWRTDAQWAVTTVQGLEACTTYTFAVKARNSDLVETAFGAGASLGTAGRLGDMTGDDIVDGGDIQLFVDCMISGGSGCACANIGVSEFVNCLLDAGTCP